MVAKKSNERVSTTVTAKKLVEETLQVVVTPLTGETQAKENKQQEQAEEEDKGQKIKPTKIEKEGKRKKKKRTKVGYGTYIYKVLKKVHPDIRISSNAMIILDNLMGDMFERIAEAAATLSKYVGRTTLSSREIQGAVKMVLPGELGKHAIAEGTKAVVSYVTTVAEEKKSKTK